MEMVQEIHQLLMDREDTCHRTCFSLQLNATTLDNFAELKSIEGLKEGSIIKVEFLKKKHIEELCFQNLFISFRSLKNLTLCVKLGFTYAT